MGYSENDKITALGCRVQSKMSIKHLILFVIFISSANFAKAFDCYSSSNRGEVGPAGSVCEGMLIVSRWRLLNATFSGSDAYTTKDGTNYYFGGTNGGVFTGQITDFSNIFLNKGNFNADIGYWDTSRATNFHQLFSGARSFNQDIGSWDVSNVTNFYRLFYNAHAFNQDLNAWDTSSVTTMRRTFFKAYAFNGDISSWNVSRVTDMQRMFNEARKFNQDIGGWDVSKVNRMSRMFKNAHAFNQDLTQWNVKKIRHEPKVFANRLPKSKKPCWGLPSCPANPLSLSSSSPADDEFDVSTSTTLTLNFSDTVYTSSTADNILLYKSDGTLVETFNVHDSASVTISGAQVSVDLSLEDNTDYYIQIGAWAFSASAPPIAYLSRYPGILNNTTLNFSTRSLDTTAPTLTSTTPQDGETDTQYENTVLRLGFSEDIAIGTGDIILYDAGGLVKAYDVSDTNYVSLDDTSSLEVPLVDNNGDSVLSPGTDYYILMDSGIVKDASDNPFAGITSSSTFNFTTSTTYCGCISGTTRRRNGNVLGGVTVRLLNSSGSVLQSVISDANGFYHFLPASAGTYTVEFAKLNGRPVVGQASYDGMSSSAAYVKNIEITTSCEEISEIDGLLVDPKGIIYDSENRLPIANATVELLLNGSVIDDSFLDTSVGTASQVTGADGEYEFLLRADTATSGTYEIRVTPPTGYVYESTEIPADGLYTPSIGMGVESIQDQSTAPAFGDDTTYHLQFAFTFSAIAGQSSQGIINNHIPLDPYSSELTVTKTADTTNFSSPVTSGDTITYTITAENTGNVSLDNVRITDVQTPAGGSSSSLTPTYSSGDINSDSVIDVGETWTWTVSYNLTQADLDAGGLSNLATVTVDDPDDTEIIVESSASGNNTTGVGNGAGTATTLSYSLISEIEDDLIEILRDDLSTTMAQQSKRIAGYSTAALDRLKLEKRNSCVNLVDEQFARKPVLFETASAKITASGTTFLNALAEHLSQCPYVTFDVEGHADSVGSSNDNLRLSYARSAAVVSVLVSRGLKRERFRATGYGETQPIAENSTVEGRRLNRRVVFVPTKPLTRNVECEAPVNYEHHFYAKGDDEGINVDGVFSSDTVGCDNGNRKYYEVQVSFVTQGTDTQQGMMTFNYIKEQNSNSGHLGHFYGVYASTNSIASKGKGKIDGFGLNLGRFGAQKVDTRLYLDYYLGAAAGQHRFELSFAHPSGDIYSNGYYTYLAAFAGIALSGETQIGDQRLAPRAGIEVAYSSGGNVRANASRDATYESRVLETGSVNGGRVFGELRFVDLLPNNKTQISIAPMGFCETQIGTRVRQCGTGISLGLSRQIEEGTYLDFSFGAEDTSTNRLYDLKLEYGLKLQQGQLTGSTSVDANGASELGMTYRLNF